MDTIELLVNFGLTRQEATIYVLLFSEGKLNGYETSKLTGISRSNTYNALAGLVEKGAAYVIEESSVYYTPVPIKEFCNNKIRLMKDIEAKLIDNMPKQREKLQGYITIKGEKHIHNKITNMLEEAKERVYLALHSSRVNEYKEKLEVLIKRGIKVVIITDKSFQLNGARLYRTEIMEGHIRIIVDSKHVLTGEITDSNNSTCLYSTNDNLVEVFKEALANKIRIIEINKGEIK